MKQKLVKKTKKQCCWRDYNFDGNCDQHRATLKKEPAPKQQDYFFSYSDRYRSGRFDMRKVVRWQSTGESYYKKYVLYFETCDPVALGQEEFWEFEKKFNKLSTTHV